MNPLALALALAFTLGLLTAPPAAAQFFSGGNAAISANSCATTNAILRQTTTAGDTLACTPMTSDGTNITLTSGRLLGPAGTAAASTYGFSANSGYGIFFRGSSAVSIAAGGVDSLDIQTSSVTLRSLQALRWANSDDAAAGTDNEITRVAANSMAGDFSLRPTTTNARSLGEPGLRWLALNVGTSGIDSTGPITTGNATPTAITNIRIYSQTITPASVAAAVCAEQAFTVTGLATGDKIFINPAASGNATSAAQARVTAADTAAIMYCNPTAGALTPGSGTYTIVAIRS